MNKKKNTSFKIKMQTIRDCERDFPCILKYYNAA